MPPLRPLPSPHQTASTLLHRSPLPLPHRHSHQIRHATLLRRPKRPYTFTQLLALSDGSTAIQRTTSPLAVYKSTRDTRNAPLWNPSDRALVGVEQDEAGRLREFRRRFGRGWDSAVSAASEEGEGREKEEKKKGDAGTAMKNAREGRDQGLGVQAERTAKAPREAAYEVQRMDEDSLLDLISSSYDAEGDQKGLKGSGGGGKRRK